MAAKNSALSVRVSSKGTLAVALLAIAGLVNRGLGQQPPDVGGSWEGPWDWQGTILSGAPPCPDGKEISHGALIPDGMYRGHVLMWRTQKNPPPNCDQFTQTTKVFVLNPMLPSTLLTVNQALPSQIFCSGSTWQGTGQLLVVGGLPSSGAGRPFQTYRFAPTALGQFSGMPPAIMGSPWIQLDDMQFARYYSTVMGLNRKTVSLPGVGSNLLGGSSLIIGGPPAIVGQEGNETWETNSPGQSSFTLFLPPAHFQPPGPCGFDPPFQGAPDPSPYHNPRHS